MTASSRQRVVIVGASLAGATTALRLRARGFEGEVVLLGDESHLPYERPMLSKEFLSGAREADNLRVAPADAYRDAEIELWLGVRAVGMTADDRRVLLPGHDSVGYDHLVFATGGSARSLNVPGGDLPGVHVLRTLDDATRLRAEAVSARAAVVIGMGLIGAEITAALLRLGLDVTVVEREPGPLAGVLPPEVGAEIAMLHRRHGACLLFDRQVTRMNGGGRVEKVVLDDETELAADLVVVGVGTRANVALATQAGATVGLGVVVDGSCRTSLPDAYAVGDVSEQWSSLLGRRVRCEHYQGAVRHGDIAAAAILGQETPREEATWFWSDQYDAQLQAAGYFPGGAEVITRGSLETGSFLGLAIVDERLVGVAGVGRARQVRRAMRLINSGARVDAASLARVDPELEAVNSEGA